MHLLCKCMYKNLLPFFLSSCFACSMLRGTSMPYLCVASLTLAFTAAITLSRFLRVYGTNHLKAGSSSIPWEFSYSATSIGFNSFKSFKRNLCSLPSFIAMSSFQPAVVVRRCWRPHFVMNYWSFFETACTSVQWSIIVSIMLVLMPF